MRGKWKSEVTSCDGTLGAGRCRRESLWRRAAVKRRSAPFALSAWGLPEMAEAACRTPAIHHRGRQRFFALAFGKGVLRRYLAR